MASELSQLKSIRIYFASKDEEEKGFYALMTSGMPVRAIANSRYIINEKQCVMLCQKGIQYIKEEKEKEWSGESKLASKKVRISILLPLKYNDGKDVEASKFLQTKEELVSRFGYCSALTPSAGTWMDSADGTRYDDDINTGFYFDVEMDDELGTFLQYYKEVLMRRFEQKQIYITYHDINVI